MTQIMGTKSGHGEARWWFASLAEIKVTAADTGGQLTIVEVTEPPGAEAPLHVHHREDEGFWVLDGEVTLYVGDETIEATAGDFAWGPRDIPHRYTVGPNGCRMLFICTPGGFENLVLGMSVPAETRTLPPLPIRNRTWRWWPPLHGRTIASCSDDGLRTATPCTGETARDHRRNRHGRQRVTCPGAGSRTRGASTGT